MVAEQNQSNRYFSEASDVADDMLKAVEGAIFWRACAAHEGGRGRALLAKQRTDAAIRKVGALTFWWALMARMFHLTRGHHKHSEARIFVCLKRRG